MMSENFTTNGPGTATTGAQVGIKRSAYMGSCRHDLWQALRASSAAPYYLDDYLDEWFFELQYKFIIDGEWRHDEHQPFVIGNYGTVNTVLLTREPDYNSAVLSPHINSGSSMDVDNGAFQRVVRVSDDTSHEPLPRISEADVEVSRQRISIFLSTHLSYELLPESGKQEEIDNPEYQRLRCRVNYHALVFKPHIMDLSHKIVDKLRAQGHFMSIHLRFEMDMLSFAGCFDIFSPEEQKILKKYQKENFAEKKLIYSERRAIGKSPLTPEEVGLFLHAMGFNSSTRIYLAAGELFGGERFMKPFRSMFPLLENHSTMDSSSELKDNSPGLLGSAVDYMVCLLSDIFMPTYDGPCNFANNLLGHQLYHGFRTALRPDRKGLAPIFIEREKGCTSSSLSHLYTSLSNYLVAETPKF